LGPINDKFLAKRALCDWIYAYANSLPLSKGKVSHFCEVYVAGVSQSCARTIQYREMPAPSKHDLSSLRCSARANSWINRCYGRKCLVCGDSARTAIHFVGDYIGTADARSEEHTSEL